MTLAIQDGADFYTEEGDFICRIEDPFKSRNDWYSIEAAMEAREQFIAEHGDTYQFLDE